MLFNKILFYDIIFSIDLCRRALNMENTKYRVYGNILYYLLKVIFLTLDVRIMGAEEKIDGKKVMYVECGIINF